MYENSIARQINTIEENLLTKLKEDTDPKLYDTLFSDGAFELKSIEGNLATLVAETTTNCTIIKNSFTNSLISILTEMLGKPVQVEILDKKSFAKKREVVQQADTSFFKNSLLQKQFTFDTFVIGKNNRSAYTASIYAVNSPGKINPIFFYSKSGLGKTHLLHAIGNQYKLEHPESKVLYITSDDFLNEYVKYIKGRKAEELRDFFDTVDVLLVDDIQLLAGKTDTQTMFFNVFNNLYLHNKQIVLTSDRAPDELKELPERLVTRFSSGLTIQITSPEKETLIDILKMKIKVQNLNPDDFPDEVLEYLTIHYGKNVRELEGAFTNLLFSLTTDSKEAVLNLDYVTRVFGKDEKRRVANGQLSIDSIIQAVALRYSLSENQIKSKSRIGQIALARQIAMYLAREMLGMTYQNIGKVFSKDHTTVMSNCDKVKEMIQKDAIFKDSVEKLQNSLIKK